MPFVLDRRTDDSLALFIDGDLQFDSRDERIYHESFVLPALALAEKCGKSLRVLVLGGGDGLCLREVLKSAKVSHCDLVDYDHLIVEMARSELAELNSHSLDDSRVNVVIDDAWQFVSDAIGTGIKYDLILCDLTVPKTIDSAWIHSVDFYQLLHGILGEYGVLAANACSPSKFSRAYFSIYNCLRTAGFDHVKPFHVPLPSFAAQGYGDDWGFFLAPKREISIAEMSELHLASPRFQLRSNSLLKLFDFADEIVSVRTKARPFHRGNGILTYYLSNPTIPSATLCDRWSSQWSSLNFAVDTCALPEPELAPFVLPPDIQEMFAQEFVSEEKLLSEILALMPSLNPGQTKEMVQVFLEDPIRFLRGIDLKSLIHELLLRASELPARLVAELKELQLHVSELVLDHTRLLAMGMRVVTVLTLVVVLGNLIYPDAVYGKGHSEGFGAISGDHYGLSRPLHTGYDSPYSSPEFATNGGFRSSSYMKSSAMDESGSVFPMRRYVYYPRSYYYGRSYYQHHASHEKASETPGVYRLTPESDVLTDGSVVIHLTDGAYLLLGKDVNTVVESANGEPILQLAVEPAQLWRVQTELQRQALGIKQTSEAKRRWIKWMDWLEFVPWRVDDLKELDNLEDMEKRLQKASIEMGTPEVQAPALPLPPVALAREIFAGVWMDPDGKKLIIKEPAKRTVYMNATHWSAFSDMSGKRSEPYPVAFKKVICDYLENEVKNSNSEQIALQKRLESANIELRYLEQDLHEYNSLSVDTKPYENVEYGSLRLPLSEALLRTHADITRAEQAIQSLTQQLTDFPHEQLLAKKMLEEFKK